MSDYIKMNRREWFKQAFTKTKDTSLKAASHAAGNLAEMSDTLKEYKWQTVADFEDLGTSPKQIMFDGKATFLVKDGEKVYATQGICIEDQQLVFWRSSSKEFYCPNCGLKYQIDGKCVQEDFSLKTWIARVNDDKVQLRLDSSD